MKESGLNEKQISKMLFGGGKSGQSGMNAFFGGDKSSIGVSELSGRLGKMLQGMEKGLNEGNIELAAINLMNPKMRLIIATIVQLIQHKMVKLIRNL